MDFEPADADIDTDLTDLTEVPLDQIDVASTDTLRRVAPADGTRLLVAASFNSAI